MPAIRTQEELLASLVKQVRLLQRRMARRGSAAWDAITGKPSTFPPSPHTQDWTTITGKPSTFPPSAHTQDWTTITGKPFASVAFGTGTARWVRVALINGTAAQNGASLEMQFGTGGNYGTLQRYTGRIHFSQRGDNIVSCVVISDTSVPGTPVTFHTRQISTYVFELWAALPTFNVPLSVQAINAFPSISASAQLLMDSVQTSAPSSLSAAIVPLVAAEDTGWVALTHGSGFSNLDGLPSAYRVKNGDVQIRIASNGTIANTTLTLVASGLPVAQRPLATTGIVRAGVAFGAGGYAGTAHVYPIGHAKEGTIEVYQTSGANRTWASAIFSYSP